MGSILPGAYAVESQLYGRNQQVHVNPILAYLGWNVLCLPEGAQIAPAGMGM
jgi:hypothetical protein